MGRVSANAEKAVVSDFRWWRWPFAWALQRGAECGAYKRGRCYFATGGAIAALPDGEALPRSAERETHSTAAQWTRSEKQARIVRSKRIL
jgi:hypothetical protein